MTVSIAKFFAVHGIPSDEKMFSNADIIFSDKSKQLTYALSLARESELHLEFGVFKGKSINHTAKLRPSDKFFGFDSFEGLPEAWVRSAASTYDKGYFKVDELPKVPANVSLIKGFFDKTLDKWIEGNPGPVSFLHIDVDLYSSAKFVLDRLTDQIGPGTIIVFDELCDWQNSGTYPNWRDDEWKALREWLDRTSLGFRVLSRDIKFSAAIEVVELSAAAPDANTIISRAEKLVAAGARSEAVELLKNAVDVKLVKSSVLRKFLEAARTGWSPIGPADIILPKSRLMTC